MKKTILIATIVLLSGTVKAQETSTRYEASTLLTKGKLELTEIYLSQVETLNRILPYAAFPIKGQTKKITSIDIPVSKYTQRKRDAVNEMTEKMNDRTQESMNEIIPYADKVDIIKGILFVQDMIEKLDKGL